MKREATQHPMDTTLGFYLAVERRMGWEGLFGVLWTFIIESIRARLGLSP